MIVSTAYENMNNFMIMDFSALTVINYIDFYYTSLLKDELKLKIEVAESKMPIVNKKIEWGSMKWYGKANYYIWRIVVWFYETVYFHFWPYLATMYSFYIIRNYV